MPRKQFKDYFKDDDWFIYNRKITSSAGNTNHYWYVFFPPDLCLPNKAFNKTLHTKDEAIAYRNEWVNYYPEIYDKIKIYLKK